MEDGSAYWTAIGAVAVAIIGIIGNKWAKSREDRQTAREITQGASTELEKVHESRPWAEMGRRLDDLKEENEKLEKALEGKDLIIDRLRDERDHARLQATDWQIEARKAAGALARVTELQQQCEQERLAHHQIVERLSSEIRRLRGDH